jgi:hypothetical protein
MRPAPETGAGSFIPDRPSQASEKQPALYFLEGSPLIARWKAESEKAGITADSL